MVNHDAVRIDAFKPDKDDGDLSVTHVPTQRPRAQPVPAAPSLISRWIRVAGEQLVNMADNMDHN
jgi:hypothetical protein